MFSLPLLLLKLPSKQRRKRDNRNRKDQKVSIFSVTITITIWYELFQREDWEKERTNRKTLVSSLTCTRKGKIFLWQKRLFCK